MYDFGQTFRAIEILIETLFLKQTKSSSMLKINANNLGNEILRLIFGKEI